MYDNIPNNLLNIISMGESSTTEFIYPLLNIDDINICNGKTRYYLRKLKDQNKICNIGSDKNSLLVIKND